MNALPTPTSVATAYDSEHTCLVWMLTFEGSDKVFQVWGEGMTFAQYKSQNASPRTASIIAEMRAADAAHAAKNAEKLANGEMRGLPRIRPALATSAGRSDAAGTATLLLRGTENILDRNNMKRDFTLPRRARSMAARRGRVTPDGLASVMAFWQNPGEMAEALLASFLPTKVSTDQAKALLADEYVSDMVAAFLATHGKGGLPTPSEAVKAVRNPSTGRSGRASGRVHIYRPGTPPTVDAKRRGRPSGPKFVAFLAPIDSRPFATCHDTEGIPGGNDVAQGSGQGYGCEVWADGRYGWSGRFPTPAQVNRRNADLDAYHAAEAKAHAERLAAEQAE